MIDDLRAENLARLAAEYGSSAALATLLGKSESQISQWITRPVNSSTGKPRAMKSATARWIEETCKKPTGWLEIDHSASVGLSVSNAVSGEIQAHENQLTLTQILEQLANRLMTSDLSTRSIVGKMLQEYAMKPDPSPRVIQAIELLLSTANDESLTPEQKSVKVLLEAPPAGESADLFKNKEKT